MPHPVAFIDPDSPLAPVIGQAYRVFARPAPRSTGVCTACCMRPEEEAAMLATAPQVIPFATLNHWLDSVNYGIDRAAWGWILPRILEVMASGDGTDYAGMILPLRHFDQTGQPDGWSQAEWRVLDRFATLYVETFAPVHGLDDVFCKLFTGGWAFDELARHALAQSDDWLARALWSQVHPYNAKPNRFVVSAFWPDAGKAQMRAFLSDKALCDRMTEHAMSLDRPDTDAAAIAFDVAEGLMISGGHR